MPVLKKSDFRPKRSAEKGEKNEQSNKESVFKNRSIDCNEYPLAQDNVKLPTVSQSTSEESSVRKFGK